LKFIFFLKTLFLHFVKGDIAGVRLEVEGNNVSKNALLGKFLNILLSKKIPLIYSYKEKLSVKRKQKLIMIILI